MPITSLSFTDAGPFDEVRLDFDSKVNVLTGPNNSGKSTVLWVLGELLVYPFTMPSKLLKSDNPTWELSYTSSTNGLQTIRGDLPAEVSTFLQPYREIGFTCYVPAQRQSTTFRSSGPTVTSNIEAVLDERMRIIRQERPQMFRETGEDALREMQRNFMLSEERSPELAKRRNLMLSGASLVSDAVMKQRIVDLDYATYRNEKPGGRDIIASIASIASEITEGFPVRFIRVSEDNDGLFPLFDTPDGEVPLDVLSQGTQSIFQYLARFLIGCAEYYDFPSNLEDMRGVLIIDEIDAHLHPTWQRRIIPVLTKRFPNFQIFCSTHSPLMLAGLKPGQVHLLRRGANGKCTVSQNESDISGWTADEVLRQFMEVPNPTDWETANRVRSLQELMRQGTLSAEQQEQLEELQRIVREDLLRGPRSAHVKEFAEELRRVRERRAKKNPNPQPSEGKNDGEAV